MTGHNCEDALAELQLYLDKELDEETVVRIEAHLRGCSPCLEAYDFEAELRRVVARGCREQAPDSLRARVLDALRACEGEVDPE
jgi:mycothiol system anti-sigma-R factor